MSNKGQYPFFLKPLHFLLYSGGLLFLAIFIFFVYLMPQAPQSSQLAFFNRNQDERQSQAATNNYQNSKCADVNSDNIVNGLDLTLVNGQFGSNNLKYDLNNDGVVDSNDVQVVIYQFNKKCQK